MSARAWYNLGVGRVGKSLRTLLPDMFSEKMHTFVGIFNSNKPANRYEVSTMLLFRKQAAAVSDTMQIQNNWWENTDSINKEQPKESGDKTLPVLLLSRSETWRLLPNSLVLALPRMLSRRFKRLLN